jgi:hypothetical protein
MLSAVLTGNSHHVVSEIIKARMSDLVQFTLCARVIDQIREYLTCLK